MATSVYFNNQKAIHEQNLLEDLIIESIRNHGIDVYYLPRESQSYIGELFGDDPVKMYRRAIKLEMYLESFQDYEGNKEFFSKFGLEIQETARLCVARRRFESQVSRMMGSGWHVPKEGDLIYLPVQFKLNRKINQIAFFRYVPPTSHHSTYLAFESSSGNTKSCCFLNF